MAEAVLDHARMLAGRNHEGHCDVAEAMEGQARIEAGPRRLVRMFSQRTYGGAVIP